MHADWLISLHLYFLTGQYMGLDIILVVDAFESMASQLQSGLGHALQMR